MARAQLSVLVLLVATCGLGLAWVFPISSWAGPHESIALPEVCWAESTLGTPAPKEALSLFDGTSTNCFDNARMTAEGFLAAGAVTKRAFRDFHIHIEFRIPYRPTAVGQERGNSGVYLQQRYEVQILDSYGLVPGEADCGSLYRQRAPSKNACLPPLVWQTFDIDFTAARFGASGAKKANARVTVRLNGVTIHDDVELTNKTGAGQLEGPDSLPLLLQNHGNPVVFRNIWIVDHCDVSTARSVATRLCAG